MDAKITQIELLLDKLNLLFEQVKIDGQLEKTEQDLMLRYTGQLSELLHSDFPVSVPPVHHHMEQKETTVPPQMEESLTREDREVELAEESLLPNAYNPVPPAELEVPILEEIRSEEPPVLVTQEVAQELAPEPLPVNMPPGVKKPLASHADEEEEAFNTGLNRKLTGHVSKKTLADKIGAQKSKDLKTVIDLNARIALTRQLFSNDKDAFEGVIKTLNNATSYAEAEQYIMDVLRPKMGWKDFSAINQLLDLVKLKFS